MAKLKSNLNTNNSHRSILEHTQNKLMNIKQHYEAFFDPNKMGLVERDFMYIEWAESLLEDYEAEKAKSKIPAFTIEELSKIEHDDKREIVEYYSQFDIVKPNSKKEGFTKEEFIIALYSKGYQSALSFFIEHRKKFDKGWADFISINQDTIQKMIDEAIETHKPKN